MVNRWRCVLEVSICYIAVLGFQHVLVDGDRVFIRGFQSAISRYLVSNRRRCHTGNRAGGPGFNPLYRGTWFPTTTTTLPPTTVKVFQSAISRYLVSNMAVSLNLTTLTKSFNPLYRGTWFPTRRPHVFWLPFGQVSIRYIAVLGFQQATKNQ